MQAGGTSPHLVRIVRRLPGADRRPHRDRQHARREHRGLSPDRSEGDVVRVASRDRSGPPREHRVRASARSATLDQKLLYVAVPVASGGKVFGAVRITYPTSALDHRINRYRLALAAVALIVLAVAALVGLLLARSIAQPLRRLEGVAARVGAGELTARASETDGPSDVRSLAREFNRTTAKLAALLTSQEQFVADASHELRTPLMALRLRLENCETDAALVEAERLVRSRRRAARARACGRIRRPARRSSARRHRRTARRALVGARGGARCASRGPGRRRCDPCRRGTGRAGARQPALERARRRAGRTRRSRSPQRPASCTWSTKGPV